MEATAANDPLDAPLIMHCPECGKPLDVSGLPPYSRIECPHCASLVRVRTTMGQYQIVGTLGEGGMSQVFRALDRNLGREVALKILHQALSRDEALTAMFEREAKLTASIVHPNVVKVYSVGQDLGYFFIAMELLQAVSLEQLIAAKGALSEPEVLGIALDVARGLQAALEEQLIHRDIKPGNMLVTDEGTTKLVDFGLALQQGGEDLSEELWATPYYVPPEKLEGATDTFLGDIYSLGATLYHALAGRPPFEANTSSLEELKAIKKLPVDLKAVAPGLSKATVKLVERMMSYSPSERPASYDEVISQIEEVRRRQFGIEPPGRARFRKRRLGAIALGGVGLLAAVAVVFVLLLSGQKGGDEGNLGFGDGDRVITAGDSSLADRFQTARDLLSAGDYRKADAIFEELVRMEAVPGSTRIWSHYFRGTIALFLGDEAIARESFANVLSITPETGDSTQEAVAFMKRAAKGLVDPLPLTREEVDFSPQSIEALGILTAGLKNWQSGAFESGAELLRAFAQSTPPPDHAWLGSLRSQVEPFLKDSELLAALPNPSASEDDGTLESHAATLRNAASALRTRGAAPKLLRSRMDRIARIRDLAKAAKEPKEKSGNAANSPGTMASNGSPTVSAAPAGNEAAELERLRALAASLPPADGAMLFSAAASKVQNENFETPLARGIREELLHACTAADRFAGRFASALASSKYEGVVRRRTGRPLEAVVTAGPSDNFIVDLGFGPNEVGIGEFAADWLIEAASSVFPPLSADTAGEWESLFFFGLLTGQTPAVEPLADPLAAVDPEFGRRWSLLRQLR